jgi:photosystem II stability/assembly factor-like uncharacterized protein
MRQFLPWIVLLLMACEPAEPTAMPDDGGPTMDNDGGPTMGDDGGPTMGNDGGPTMGNDGGPNAVDAGDIVDSGNPAATGSRQLGPATGGFASQVVFGPDGTPWLSGDDSSGLYRRTQTGWSLIESVPPDWSTYAWRFDPNDPQRMYAPNHFGRGMLRSDDGGDTWTAFAIPEAVAAHWYDLLAIDVDGATRLMACGSFGVLRSDDGGESFSEVNAPSFGESTGFQALHRDHIGRIYLGNDQGGLFTSDDSGESWEVMIEPQPDGIGITAITSTRNALYIGFAFGLVARTRTFDVAGVEVLDTQMQFGSYLWTRIGAVSGTAAAEDVLWVGTVGPTPNGAGLFVSNDGGDSFVVVRDDISVFDLAIDPTDAQRVLLATVNGPILESMDGGTNWSDVSRGVIAWDSLAIGQNPDDPDHLLFSSLAGIPGNGLLMETRDGGQTWSIVLDAPDTYAIEVFGDDLVVGDFFAGIHRRTDGQWQKVLDIGSGVRAIARDTNTPGRLVAVTSERGMADLGVYESMDSGLTWSLYVAIPGLNLSVLPSGDVLLASGDVVFASNTGAVGAGLAEAIEGAFVTTVAFHPADHTRLLAATDNGRVFSTSGCTADTSPCIWTEHESPAAGGFALVEFGHDRRWYLSGATVDTAARPDYQSGLWQSTDEGMTWTAADDDLYPSRIIWRLARSARALAEH